MSYKDEAEYIYCKACDEELGSKDLLNAAYHIGCLGNPKNTQSGRDHFPDAHLQAPQAYFESFLEDVLHDVL